MKVLIAEDEPISRLLTSEKLKSWGYSVIEVENGKEVIESIERQPDIQLCILDWEMPEIDGLELCSRLREIDRAGSFYIIILTSKHKASYMIEALDKGADDFISKPFVPEELRVRLQVGARILKKENQLIHAAESDPLTGILNRKAFLLELDKIWALTKRQKQPFAILMLDIDHFKQVNDKFGHIAGDQVLKQFCELVKQQIRQYDCFARYGGEEFVLFLPDTDVDQCERIAERIRATTESKLFTYDGEHVSMTVSIGASIYYENYLSAQEMLKAADKAAYEAKQAGRNKVVLATLPF